MIVPTLGHDAHGAGAGVDEMTQRGVVVHLALGASRGTERDERAGGELQFRRGAREEFDVLRVGARPSTLDEVHAEKIQLFGDAQLVLHRRGDALHLQSVAQCGVEDFDHVAHVGSVTSSSCCES